MYKLARCRVFFFFALLLPPLISKVTMRVWVGDRYSHTCHPVVYDLYYKKRMGFKLCMSC